LIAGATGIIGAATQVQSIGWTVNELAGLTIAIPAFCLWALARLQLGASFAVRAHARALVTHGLYSRIQNPIYVFGALLIMGAIVFSGRPIWFLIFVILIPAQLNRIRKERAVLEATFGDEYRRYRKSTWL
jgi:protein-S-isoprenylcysteine O-methyltransferase Ste14